MSPYLPFTGPLKGFFSLSFILIWTEPVFFFVFSVDLPFSLKCLYFTVSIIDNDLSVELRSVFALCREETHPSRYYIRRHDLCAGSPGDFYKKDFHSTDYPLRCKFTRFRHSDFSSKFLNLFRKCTIKYYVFIFTLSTFVVLQFLLV